MKNSKNVVAVIYGDGTRTGPVEHLKYGQVVLGFLRGDARTAGVNSRKDAQSLLGSSPTGTTIVGVIFANRETWDDDPDNPAEFVVEKGQPNPAAVEISAVAKEYVRRNAGMIEEDLVQADEEMPTDEFAMTLGKRRRHQAKFRNLLTTENDACWLTGARAVLEAAHIQGLSSGGRSVRNNGVILRPDLHRLFDSGLITIDACGKVLVSSLLSYSDRAAYGVDRDLQLNESAASAERKANLQWHRENTYRP